MRLKFDIVHTYRYNAHTYTVIRECAWSVDKYHGVMRNLEAPFFLGELAHGFLSVWQAICIRLRVQNLSSNDISKQYQKPPVRLSGFGRDGVCAERDGGVDTFIVSPGDEVMLVEGGVADTVGGRVQLGLEGALASLFLSHDCG